MAKVNMNHAAFVNALRMHGGPKYFDLGGQATPTLAPQATTQSSNVTAGLNAGNPLAGVNSTQGAIAGGIAGSYFGPVGTAAGAVGGAALPAINNAVTNVAGQTIGGIGSLTQDVAGAFTSQNGYNAQLAPTTQLNYAPLASQAANQSLTGYGQAQENIASGQALQQQLAAEGLGQGPNPAQAALAQNTSTNVANQAALMAGQRGAGANAGEVARQAAQTGAATQQNAVGQAATLQAQQELAAQQGALQAQGQVGQQITAEQAANNQLAGTAIGANNTQNANLISNYGMAQGLNQSTAQSNANAVNQTTGGLLNGASSIASLLAEGGEVGKDGKSPASNISDSFNNATALGAQPQPTPAPQVAQNYAAGGPVSWAGQYLANPTSFAATDPGQSAPMIKAPAATSVGVKMPSPPMTKSKPQPNNSAPVQGSAQTVSGVSDTPGAYAETGGGDLNPDVIVAAKGGKVSSKKVPAMLSPGEQYLPPAKAKAVAQGKADPMSGKHIPGKAKVAGDSLKNDTVKAELDEGGVVVKRSVMATHDPKKVQQFVQAIMAKSGPKRK